jgi:2-dehydropantoate 2-reductase
MAQDVAKGRRSEIAEINGLVVREAEAYGLDAPLNKTLVETVRMIEAGAASPSLALAASIRI